ncbi:MAG TPA: hypothetical protein VNX26_06665 [Candidatus Acidoferrum sp.]|jgi:hypothetical protein|nr:hypothetical protein [Candidatus Acidoferrum sp.]
MGSGICGTALVRAANAMLTALGGDDVSLLLPATATASDAAGQLGLVDPGVQEVIITPVVVRNVPVGNLGPRRRIEFTLPASAIEMQLPTLGMGSAEDLFKAALGLMHDGDLFHIEAILTENFAGTAYFYVVTAVE